jgi:hypothetical protein
VKRRALKLFVFVLVGAIINVAVAWGIAAFRKPSLAGHSFTREYGDRNFRDVISFHRGGIKHSRVSVWGLNGGQTTWTVIAGWPQKGLYCTRKLDRSVSRDIKRFGVTLKDSHNTKPSFGWRALPLMPIFPGFAINTIFYAAIVWVLFAVPGAIRRRVRRKRGQCAACGYSLRENPSEKCPECGAKATNRFNLQKDRP